MPLSQDKVNELLAKRRKKGVYEERLVEAVESDEMGFDAHDDWPEDFAPGGVKKSATTIYQGFRNAAEKLGILDTEIEVVQRDGSVFLLIKSRTNGVNTASEESESSDEDVEVPVTTANGDQPAQ